MQLVAWADSLQMRLFGVALASISSGGGELSFIGMTHFYGKFAVPFWSSGTGAAGLLGAGLYVLATSWVGWSVRGSLMVFGFLPVVMLFTFFVILPLDVLKGKKWDGYEPIVEGAEVGEAGALLAPEENGTENALLLSIHPAGGQTFHAVSGPGSAAEKRFPVQSWNGFQTNLRKTKLLFFPL